MAHPIVLILRTVWCSGFLMTQAFRVVKRHDERDPTSLPGDWQLEHFEMEDNGSSSMVLGQQHLQSMSPRLHSLLQQQDPASAKGNGSNQSQSLLSPSSFSQGPVHLAELEHLAQPKSRRPLWIQPELGRTPWNASSIWMWLAEVRRDLVWEKEQVVERASRQQHAPACFTASCADGCDCGWGMHCNRATRACGPSLEIMALESVVGFFVLGFSVLILRTCALVNSPERMHREPKKIYGGCKPSNEETIARLRMQSSQSDADVSRSQSMWEGDSETCSEFSEDLDPSQGLRGGQGSFG